MKQTIQEIEINGVTYVPKSEATATAPSIDGLPLVIIRASSSGVHYGYLKSRTGDEVELVNARRLWYWSGAASLSQLAVDGTSKPKDCKFSVITPAITVLGVCEVIPVTSVAQKVIDGVQQWRS